MTTKLARRYAALIACAGLGLATSALAQDKTVKIGVLNDMSSLYADIGGANSVIAVKMAVEDFRSARQGLEDRRSERRSPEQAGYRYQHGAAMD